MEKLEKENKNLKNEINNIKNDDEFHLGESHIKFQYQNLSKAHSNLHNIGS